MVTIIDLLQKGGEYYACARHGNARGLTEVLRETKEIVRQLARTGIFFNAVLDERAKHDDTPFDPKEDPFLGAVQEIYKDVIHGGGLAAPVVKASVVPANTMPSSWTVRLAHGSDEAIGMTGGDDEAIIIFDRPLPRVFVEELVGAINRGA